MNTTFATGRAAPAAPDIPTFRSIAAIAAVLLGAIIATLTSRITSLAADVRGALGVGVDEGAWINTAFTASQMFVGPLAIAAAFMFGTRRVLVAGAVVFLGAETVLPLCTQFGAFVVFQAIAGVRRVRPADGRLRRPDAAAATHCVRHRRVCDESRDVAEPVGHARRLVQRTPELALAVLAERGADGAVHRVPAAVAGGRAGQRFASGLDARGMLLGAGGFACLCVALDQGERLFWLQSPLIVALLALGILMVAAFLIHELASPRAGLDLGYLARPNVALLIVLVGLVRFTVLNTSFIPSLFLASTYGLRPLQIGDTLRWIAIPQLLFALRRAAAAARRSAPADRGRLRDGGDRLRARRAPHVRVGRTRLHSVATAAGARADDGADVGDLLFGKHVTAEHALTFGAVVQTTRLLSGQLGTTSIAVIQRIRRVPIRISSVCMCRCRIPRRSSGCAPARRRW